MIFKNHFVLLVRIDSLYFITVLWSRFSILFLFSDQICLLRVVYIENVVVFLAHNGNVFDFPILFKEIQSALSIPPYSANADNQCVDDINVNNSNDDTSLPTKDCSVQTTNNYHNQTTLFSIDCADSLAFFREMYRLLNDKDLVQYPIETTPSEPSNPPNEQECNNHRSPDPIEPTSSPHLGYIEIPIKYIPSPDPARQQLSMKLGKIYEREFNEKASCLKAHRAEDDCLMLLAILKRYLPDWLEWIESNHRLLNDFHSLSLTTTTRKSPPKPVVHSKPRLKF